MPNIVTLVQFGAAMYSKKYHMDNSIREIIGFIA